MVFTYDGFVESNYLEQLFISFKLSDVVTMLSVAVRKKLIIILQDLVTALYALVQKYISLGFYTRHF